MAKYKVEYENKIEKHTLTFRDKKFDFSMIPTRSGAKSDKKCFSVQINKEFPDMALDILDDEIDLDMLNCSDEDDIFEILSNLEKYENKN